MTILPHTMQYCTMTILSHNILYFFIWLCYFLHSDWLLRGPESRIQTSGPYISVVGTFLYSSILSYSRPETLTL